MRNFVKKQNGITLIALVVTIIVLIILAGVSINMLVGDNGIINMAQRAKNETEQAAKEEQQALASAFERNYVTYNGQLHLEGAKLMNEQNEEMQLKGVVLSSIPDDEYNKERLVAVKNWGINIIRVGLWASELNEENMNKLYEFIDMCISLDLYVDVIYWNSGDYINDYINEAKEYFGDILNRYQNSKNLIFEICNEPTVTWEEIKQYANEVIPIIRNINKDAIIICGTPNACSSIHVPIDNKLEYDNIMYSRHFYVPSSESEKDTVGYNDNYRHLQDAILNDIPIIVSEWSAGSSDGVNFDVDEANKFMSIVKENNLSWIYYNLWPDNNYTYCIINKDYWTDISNPNALTESGIYLKSILNNKNGTYQPSIDDYVLYNNGVNQKYYFWDENYRSNIVKIEFGRNTTENIPNNVIKKWNLSNNGMGDIIGYIVEDNSKYNLYIISNNEIHIKNFGYYFWNFTNLEEIKFCNINTSELTNMDMMFGQCEKLNVVDFGDFDTSNVLSAVRMFAYTTSLKNIDISSFNLSNATNLQYMFAYSGASTIDLSNSLFNSSAITNEMFIGCNPQQIIVKNQEAKNFLLTVNSNLNITISGN